MTGNRIDSIQALRGIAATLVALFHLQAASTAEGFDPGFLSLFQHGEVGVDIFFVISGFVICYSASRSRSRSLTVARFAVARFWRILPVYWVILTIYIAASLALLLVQGKPVELPDTRTLLVSYLLLPYPDHVIIIAWTLSIEILFYIVFALTFVMSGVRVFLVAMTIWVVSAQLFLYIPEEKSAYLVFVLHSCILEFLLGSLIAMAYLRNATPYQLPALGLGSLLLGVYLLFPHPPGLSRELYPGIPAVMIVYGSLWFTARLPAWIILWGESSYVLYLGHILLFSIIGNLLEILVGFNVYGSIFAMIAMLAIALVSSCLVTKYAERPYQAWYRRSMLQPRKPADREQLLS